MKKLIILALVLFLSACGTTSSLRNSQNPDSNLDFSKYDTVAVNDFKDEVNPSHDDPNIISEGKRFADIIASNIKAKMCSAK
ncbi:MAG: hypothetical protein HRU36_03795 [Rickettsiales bacterium]|nr:hypothetical protein [Rickettsiales bacterium]